MIIRTSKKCQNGGIRMAIIGVLALQGAFLEHCHCLKSLGHQVQEVRRIEDLAHISGLILPGGESTAMSNLLQSSGLLEKIKDKIENGLPVLATCAGLILLAKRLQADSLKTFEILDITVKRNAYGRQSASFVSSAQISSLSSSLIPLVFIRAPIILEVAPHIEVLHRHEGNIVAVQDKNIIALSFHPELTKDLTFHRLFLERVSLKS
jgi:pyridoxal 5'-phosphate synthase pdxT subunit